jgi:hypothetical protein
MALAATSRKAKSSRKSKWGARKSHPIYFVGRWTPNAKEDRFSEFFPASAGTLQLLQAGPQHEGEPLRTAQQREWSRSECFVMARVPAEAGVNSLKRFTFLWERK